MMTLDSNSFIRNTRHNLVVFGVYAMLALPFLYFAYKYGTPEFGAKDVYSYYKLYADWDFASVDSPFNQRLISSYSIYLIHLSGIHYDTQIAVQSIGMDPQVYFSAILFNWFCVVLTCCMIYHIARRLLGANITYSFITGSLFLFGFGTLVFLITALSDALSVLMVAVLFYLYEKKSRWQYVILLLSIIQREHILLMFGLFTFIKMFADKHERRYNLFLLIGSIVAFAGYIAIRKLYFSTPRYEHQMDVSAIFHMMKNSFSDVGAYIRQSFLLQNLLFIYVALYVYKILKKMEVNRVNMIITVCLLLQSVLLSLALGLGNNTGRYFYMSMPIVIYYIASEARVFFEEKTVKRS